MIELGVDMRRSHNFDMLLIGLLFFAMMAISGVAYYVGFNDGFRAGYEQAVIDISNNHLGVK